MTYWCWYHAHDWREADSRWFALTAVEASAGRQLKGSNLHQSRAVCTPFHGSPPSEAPSRCYSARSSHNACRHPHSTKHSVKGSSAAAAAAANSQPQQLRVHENTSHTVFVGMNACTVSNGPQSAHTYYINPPPASHTCTPAQARSKHPRTCAQP